MSIGVVVVDDSAEQLARELVLSFSGDFELKAAYRHSGSRNISKARNLAVETASEIGDWIAMTDDDCEPSDHWLTELHRVQRETGAQVITGPLVRRAPDGSPRWLIEQPFLSASRFDGIDGQEMEHAFTNNSMLSSILIKENPDLRFKPEFGRIGGEDMVFYRQVAKSGYKICFAQNALVYENEEPERLTIRYQMRRFFWYGNTSIQTSLERGVTRPRLATHSLATLGRAILFPLSRVIRGKKPQMLYSLALVLEGAGKLVGVIGITVKHR
jgi:succinoglycan biosynthesis protein ExoM